MLRRITYILIAFAMIIPSIMMAIPYPTHATTTTLNVIGDGTFSADPASTYAYVGAPTNFTNMNSNDAFATVMNHNIAYGEAVRTTWQMAAMPAATINSVTVYTVVQSNNNLGFFVNIGGVNFYGGSHAFLGVWHTDSYTWANSPATGVAWTAAEINAARWGVISTGISYVLSPNDFTYFYLVVDYVATPPSVETSAASSLGVTTTTLNGSITNTGGASVQSEGFVWDTSSHTPLASTNVTPGNGYASWWYQNGTYGVGSYSHGLTGLTAGTTYYYRACANNTYGWNYGDEMSFKTVGIPSISTQPATSIATTSAQLNSLVVYDGEQACDVRFGYGTTSQPATAVGFNAYDTRTAWVNNTYVTGNIPYVAPITLVLATTYYYNVQIENDAGISYGVEGTFTTSTGISEPTNFVAIPNSNSITLVWTKGTGSATTYVKYSTSTYPNTTADGTVVYSGILASYTHTNLTAGTTYYYSAWGASGGLYSTTKATTMGTTSAGAVTANIAVPTVTDSKWVMMPSELGLVNFPFYTFGNWIADTYELPRATFWLACYMLLVVGICMFIYMKAPSNNLLLTGMAGVMFLGFGTLLSPPLIPIWAAFAFLIAMITIGWVVNRY